LKKQVKCLVCKDLKRVLESADADYKSARSSPLYLVSTQFAAMMQVDMERARSAWSEHAGSCMTVDLAAEPSRYFLATV